MLLGKNFFEKKLPAKKTVGGKFEKKNFRKKVRKNFSEKKGFCQKKIVGKEILLGEKFFEK